MVKHYRNTHKDTSRRIYEERKDLRHFRAWLPDNERLRGLGEFEIDEELIKTGWAGGADRKFYAVSSKYSVSYKLTNPSDGPLSQTRDEEGARYELHQRGERLVEEFGNAGGVVVG